MPEINTEYVIELYRPSKHVGGIRHIAFYTCGFWRGLDGNLIALHSDVKSWNPSNTTSSETALARLPVMGIAKIASPLNTTVGRKR